MNKDYYAIDEYQNPKVNYSPRSKRMDDPLAVRILLVGGSLIALGLILAAMGVIK